MHVMAQNYNNVTRCSVNTVDPHPAKLKVISLFVTNIESGQPAHPCSLTKLYTFS